jgi:hypothetical protein
VLVSKTGAGNVELENTCLAFGCRNAYAPGCDCPHVAVIKAAEQSKEKIKKCSRNTFELNVGMEVEWKRLEDQRNEPLPDNARLYLLYYCASAQSPDELLFSHSSEALKEKLTVVP